MDPRSGVVSGGSSTVAILTQLNYKNNYAAIIPEASVFFKNFRFHTFHKMSNAGGRLVRTPAMAMIASADRDMETRSVL
jgi:hypothetical protein